jgi:hypothetical protein
VVDGGGHVVEGGGLQAGPAARQRIVHMSTAWLFMGGLEG